MKKKLLIIEDDPIFAKSLNRALSKRDFSCKIAHDSQSALSINTSFQPTHILLDLKLDEENGLDLISPLKKSNSIARIVILTGFGTIPTTVEAMKLGASSYLCKPTSIDEIMKQLLEIPSSEAPTDLKDIEDHHILKVLKQNNGNISKTAIDLGLHRRTLQRKLKKIDYS